MPWLYVLIFIISCLVLVRSGTLVVRALTRIAQFLGWKEFVVASILMAFTTSLPELFVGLTSAFNNQPELAFGTVVGSNIIILTLVVGIAALSAKGLKFEGKTLQESIIYTGIVALLPLLLMLDGEISRIDGIVLLLSLLFYFYRLFSQKEMFTKVLTDHFRRDWAHLRTFLTDLGFFGLGVFLLLLSSWSIVFSASRIAAGFNLSLLAMGLFLVALGTSIPEVTFGIKSIIMGHEEMVIGDAIGSVVVNSSLVLGLVAIISPFKISTISLYLVGVFFTIVAVLSFLVFARTGQRINRKEALFLIGIYLSFILFEFLIK